jgi:HPt (histidine-containing phosphotransfer) domain-containing protein
VRRIGGSVATYYSLLEKFRRNQQGVIDDIRTALMSGERDRAERLAHTLHGVSGTLGAVEVQSRAREIEKRIREGDEQAGLLLPQLEQELEKLFATIDCALQARIGKQSDTRAEIGGPIDRDQLASLLQTMKEQMEDFDSGVADGMEKLRQMTAGDAAMHDALEAIARCIEKYDYERGLVELQAWAGKQGLEL